MPHNEQFIPNPLGTPREQQRQYAEFLRAQRQHEEQEAAEQAAAAAAAAASAVPPPSNDNDSPPGEDDNNGYNLNFDGPIPYYDRDDVRNAAFNAMNEYLRRRNLILQNANDLSDSVGKILNSKLKFNMIKESPLLKQLYLSDAFVSYEKVIKNDILERIYNITINLDFLEGLKNNDPQSYADNFYILAQENKVNTKNTLRVSLPGNGLGNVLIKTFEFSYKELSILTKLILSYGYYLNIPYNGNFSKKIFLYEVNEANEVVGSANFEFGNRTININKNIFTIF